LINIFTKVIEVSASCGICYLAYLGLKFVVTLQICKHPELSDEKVKCITRMIAKDRHHSI